MQQAQGIATILLHFLVERIHHCNAYLFIICIRFIGIFFLFFCDRICAFVSGIFSILFSFLVFFCQCKKRINKLAMVTRRQAHLCVVIMRDFPTKCIMKKAGKERGKAKSQKLRANSRIFKSWMDQRKQADWASRRERKNTEANIYDFCTHSGRETLMPMLKSTTRCCKCVANILNHTILNVMVVGLIVVAATYVGRSGCKFSDVSFHFRISFRVYRLPMLHINTYLHIVTV